MRITGAAKFEDESESNFAAPVHLFKLEAEFVPEDNAEVLQINPKALKPTVKDFTIDLGDVSFENSSLSEACRSELHEGLIEGVMQVYDSIWQGDMLSLQLMPVESFLPLIMIRHVGGFAME